MACDYDKRLKPECIAEKPQETALATIGRRDVKAIWRNEHGRQTGGLPDHALV